LPLGRVGNGELVTNTISESDPSEREFGQSGIALSTYRFPTGWFIVASPTTWRPVA
jgi:hypothetical protein